MVTKSNPEKEKGPGIGKLRFTTSMMENMLEIEKRETENKTKQEKTEKA